MDSECEKSFIDRGEGAGSSLRAYQGARLDFRFIIEIPVLHVQSTA